MVIDEDKISQQRASALLGVLAAKPDFSLNPTLAAFLSEYFLCEALANKLIEYWEIDIPPSSTKPSKIIKCSSCGTENECITTQKKRSNFKTLDVGNIKKALLHFSLEFSPVNADSVFKSGTGIVGKRTARQLRNEYAHSLSLSASNEIAQRFTELMNPMANFSLVVHNRVTAKI